ncbi:MULTISPECIES: pheA operon leader peptide PheL [unclassified Erwinia]|nr:MULTISPECIES: pheA operon leader peptide PheL [unclassified Erwinia]
MHRIPFFFAFFFTFP